MSWKSASTAGKTVIKVPLRVERRAAKRLEAKRLEALRESGTAYPRGNRDIPPIIACRRTELNHYFGQRYNPFIGKLPLASEHWASRRTIGDYFSFSAFRGAPATNWHKILQKKLEREQENIASDNTDLLSLAEERGLLIFKGGEYDEKDYSKAQKPTFRASPYSSQIDPLLLNAAEKCGYKYPTNIQDISIPVLLSGESAIVASETGNGKTLAYLLPILQRSMRIKAAIKKAAQVEDSSKHAVQSDTCNEVFGKFNSLSKHKNRPLAIVITPSRELAIQIYQVAVMLKKAAIQDVKNEVEEKLGITTDAVREDNKKDHDRSEMDLKIKLVLGGNVKERIETEIKREVDIVIGTVGALHKMFANKHYFAGSVCSLVFDEADSLFDDSFVSLTNKLLSKLCRVDPVLTEAMSIAGENIVQNNEEAPLAETQVLFVGATLPKIQPSSPVGSLVNTEQLKILRTGQLHRVLPHVKQKFIRAPKVKREEYLLRVVEKDIKAGNPVIIFSNKASTSNFIAHVINDRFGNSLNKDECDEVNEEQRSNVCIAFNSSVYWRKRAEVLKKFTNGDIGVLSCTDLASRGLNLDGRATHVINYDFPSNLSDYLHRVGRVGRVGQSKIGKVTSLVCGQVSISVAQELERSVRLNIELPNVDANVPSLIQQRHAEVETSDE